MVPLLSSYKLLLKDFSINVDVINEITQVNCKHRLVQHPYIKLLAQVLLTSRKIHGKYEKWLKRSIQG